MSEQPAIERIEDPAAWDAFVERTPGGHVFLTSWWHAAWGVTPELHVLRGRDGGIAAGVALVRGRWLGGDAVRRPPFTPYNHPLVDTERVKDAVRQHASLGMVLDRFHDFRTLDFAVPFDVPLMGLPYVQRGFETQLGISYVIRAAGAGAWRDAITGGHRRHARAAAREAAEKGWAVAADGDGASLWPLLQLTAEEKGYTMSLEAGRFVRAVDALRARDAAEVWMVRSREGAPLAGTLLVRGRACAHYLAGGLRADLRRGSSVNYLLFEHMIGAALERGLDFDFEGSSIPGVEQFFRGWGGEACHVFRQIRIRPAALHMLVSAARRRSRAARGISSGSPG